MLDRGIGVAGLALALIFGALPYFAPKLPHWISTAGLVAGILVLGLSVGLVAADRRNAGSIRQPVDKAFLRLHIYGDNRTPERISADNIFRWYYLKTIVMREPKGAQQIAPQSETIAATLFVTFEPEVKISTIQVQSPDAKLPFYEVKEFNQRYAIIVFTGDIGTGTLEISVNP
jgi:hypothetical protein